MFPALRPPEPPLSDEVVTLRIPDVARDAATLAHMSDSEIVRRTLGAPPNDADPHEVFAGQLDRWRRGTDAFFSIDAVGHDERVGFARVMFGLYDPFRFAEIGYILFPPGRGRGYATRAVRLVARWLFDDLGVGRLQARTHAENVASQHVLERVGFQREGVARAGHVLPASGEHIDTIMWSLLPGDTR